MPKPHTALPDGQVVPDSNLEKRVRRDFSPEYKLKILAEADACQRGEIGVLLRRERLYSSQLRQWRQEFASAGVAGLSKTAPGPAQRKTAEQRRIEQLELENSRLQRRLQIAEDCLDLQKKTLSVLDQMRKGNAA